jgi:hypothetical protein
MDYKEIERIAWEIYIEVYGAIDDKYFMATKTQEIEDWLHAGDPDGIAIWQLVNDWREIDYADIEERIGE